MDKKEYLKNRFRRDFLQYSLLQDNSLSDRVIANKLWNVVDLSWLVDQGQDTIEKLNEKYLSFEKVEVDGELSDELPEDLGYDIKDIIIRKFEEYLDSYSIDEISVKIVSDIERSIELQTWTNGIVNMPKAIEILVRRLCNSAKNYSRLHKTTIPEDDLIDKYSNAKKNTLFERIKGNNIYDILEYRSAMIEYVRVTCENLLHAKLQDVYNYIANNKVFEQLVSHFNSLYKYAMELKNSIADYEVNEEWDKEYNNIIPTDFYHRNVENITAEHAFQMTLLQFFARNEEWMIENGLLVNGELKVYVSLKGANIREILDRITLS